MKKRSNKMSIKVFQTNKNGKIEFTRCELEKLLNEIYKEGYKDGEIQTKKDYWTWTPPSLTSHPYSHHDILYTTNNTGTPINNLVATNTSNTATISAADCTIGTNEAEKISVRTHGEAKDGKADISTSILVNGVPAQTYEAKGMTFNLNDLAKTVDAMLSGKVDLFNPTNIKTGKVTAENPFNSLAKELTDL
jgi:hypothetical protein